MNAIQRHVEVYSQALNLRAQRHQILASNIANADTPHYKAQDFDFSSALKEAMAGRSSGDLPLAKTSPGHIAGGSGSGSVRLMYRTPSQDSDDGNTVDMDNERAQFSENAIQYEAGLTFITHHIKSMMTAIQA